MGSPPNKDGVVPRYKDGVGPRTNGVGSTCLPRLNKLNLLSLKDLSSSNIIIIEDHSSLPMRFSILDLSSVYSKLKFQLFLKMTNRNCQQLGICLMCCNGTFQNEHSTLVKVITSPMEMRSIPYPSCPHLLLSNAPSRCNPINSQGKVI